MAHSGARNHARAECVAGFSTARAAWALKPLRTDTVTRGLCISLFKLEMISLAISIRLLFFTKRPFFERSAVNCSLRSELIALQAADQVGSNRCVRVYAASSLATPPRISPAPASEQK